MVACSFILNTLPQRQRRHLYRQYGWLCVCLLCRLYCSNAIVSLNCYTAKCGRRNAEVQVTCKGVVTVGNVQGHRLRSGIVTGLALSDEPTFHNVFRLPVNKKVCQEIRSHFINKQRHSFWPFSSLTWCCALLLHKY